MPADDALLCPGCGHRHVVGRDRHGHRALPDTVEQRNDTEDSWCDTCMDAHEDRDAWYTACALCNTRLDVPTVHTGPFSFPVVTGSRLVPETMHLRQAAGGEGVTVPIGKPIHLQDADGNDLFPVLVEEFGCGPGEESGYGPGWQVGPGNITAEIRPLGDAWDVIRMLHSALYGED